MKEIKDAFELWLKAKKAAQRECEAAGELALARKFRACRMFSGDEDIEKLTDKMFTPQGIEFLTKRHFPDLETFRWFLPYEPERYGFYIDRGEVEIKDAENVFLVGNTTAHLSYSFDKPHSCKLVMMHGAKAVADVKGWTLLSVYGDGTCDIQIHKLENSIVLR